MNKENIKEFENEQLNTLLEELKDIDKFTGFSNGAFKYELGKYRADLLLDYINNLKQALNEIREYVMKEKEFNDNQIAEYKTCIETNENGKFNDKEKENFEHCMTVNICINYKMNDILQIIDKVLGDEK